MAQKDAVERRVYNLPSDLVERLKAYQVEQKIGSETEAARRLLEAALQMRDDVPAINRTLRTRFTEERNLRILARDVLADHALVKSVQFGDTDLVYTITGDERGRIDKFGQTYVAGGGSYDNWEPDPPPVRHRERGKAAGGGWDAPKADLDDDIPF